jgi:hypothetical protein
MNEKPSDPKSNHQSAACDPTNQPRLSFCVPVGDTELTFTDPRAAFAVLENLYLKNSRGSVRMTGRVGDKVVCEALLTITSKTARGMSHETMTIATSRPAE